MSKMPITIAVSKGRVWEDLQPILAAAGLAPNLDGAAARSLIIPCADSAVRFVVVRGQDVPIYVAYGAAAAGVVGSDVLAENPLDDIYQPLDLGISRCRLVVAARAGFDLHNTTQKIAVATKYIRQARQYMTSIGTRADYIKIHGAAELAPLIGMADVIVDLVQTGNTLRAHDLVEIATVQEVSAVFITNRIASRKCEQLARVQKLLAGAVDNTNVKRDD